MTFIRFKQNAQYRGVGYFENDVIEIDPAGAQAYVDTSQAEIVPDDVVAAAEAELEAAAGGEVQDGEQAAEPADVAPARRRRRAAESTAEPEAVEQQ